MLLSGTSMATAVTTGSIALLVEANRAANYYPQRPSLTPNAVKAILRVHRARDPRRRRGGVRPAQKRQRLAQCDRCNRSGADRQDRDVNGKLLADDDAVSVDDDRQRQPRMESSDCLGQCDRVGQHGRRQPTRLGTGDRVGQQRQLGQRDRVGQQCGVDQSQFLGDGDRLGQQHHRLRLRLGDRLGQFHRHERPKTPSGRACRATLPRPGSSRYSLAAVRRPASSRRRMLAALPYGSCQTSPLRHDNRTVRRAVAWSFVGPPVVVLVIFGEIGGRVAPPAADVALWCFGSAAVVLTLKLLVWVATDHRAIRSSTSGWPPSSCSPRLPWAGTPLASGFTSGSSMISWRLRPRI